MDRILVIVRHAKSDWDVQASDRDRPLSPRGRRQAPATGRWIAVNVPTLDLAVVSVARRARETWECIAAELGQDVPPVRLDEDAYTFSGRDLLELVRELPEDCPTAALVSHNPAVEELARALTGEWVFLPTSAVAVASMPTWADAGQGDDGRLLASGRPADGRGGLSA